MRLLTQWHLHHYHSMDLCAGHLMCEEELRARRREFALMQAERAAEQSAVLPVVRRDNGIGPVCWAQCAQLDDVRRALLPLC